MKKRAFVLLELLIAIGLVSLVIIPIHTYPQKIYHKELSLFLETELHYLADVAFADLLNQLSKQIDAKTLTISSPSFSKEYSISLKNYTWHYLAQWELVIHKKFSNKALLEAHLHMLPLSQKESSKKSRKNPSQIAPSFSFRYFIEKKEPSHDNQNS